jgi:glutathione S-transferase
MKNNILKLKLVGSKMCPFVHRIQILLNFYNLPHTSEHIDLQNKPAWFLKLSPHGKVPLLRVDEKTILFESAVIAEYLDEIAKTSTLPTEPLTKAVCRSWILFGNELVGSFHRAMWASDNESEKSWQIVHHQLKRLNRIKEENNTTFFSGNEFSLVDSAFASVFYRINVTENKFNFPILEKYSYLEKWSESILEQPFVIESHPKNFIEKWCEKINNKSRIADRA